MNLGLERWNLEICGGKRIGKKKGILDFLQRRSEIKNIQRLIEIKREEEANKNETPNEAAASAELVV